MMKHSLEKRNEPPSLNSLKESACYNQELKQLLSEYFNNIENEINKILIKG